MGVIFAILGGILKWILLIIFGLIGLILVLLLVVLLTPLRYKIKWTKQADVMEGDVRVSWLLRLISFRLIQNGKEIKWTVRIGPKIIAASYPLPKKEKKPKKKKQKRPEPSTEPPAFETLPQEDTVQVEPPQAERAEEIPAVPEETVKPEAVKEEPKASETGEPEAEAEPKPKPKRSWRRKVTDICWKIRRIFEKIIHPVRTIREKLRTIRQKLRDLLDKWDQVKAIWDGYPQKGETVRAVKALVGGILKAPLPKKYDVKLRFGMKDPATTGQILMYYYSLSPVLFPKTTRRRRFELEADFENPVIEVTATCKGRFSIGSFLWPVIRALFNGHIRRLIRYVVSVKKKFSNKER